MSHTVTTSCPFHAFLGTSVTLRYDITRLLSLPPAILLRHIYPPRLRIVNFSVPSLSYRERKQVDEQIANARLCGIVGTDGPLGDAVAAANGDGNVFGPGGFNGDDFRVTGDVVGVIPPPLHPPPSLAFLASGLTQQRNPPLLGASRVACADRLSWI